jgi:uncharacterized protein YqgC (DUF456 family)
VDGSGLFVIALIMAVGLVGVVIPVLPGLLLIWGAGLVWVLLDGGGPARWTVLAMMTGLWTLGTVAKYVLPARSLGRAGAGFTTTLVGAVGAIVGFFAIPVIGLVVGGVLGILLAEIVRQRDVKIAWRSTRAVLVGVGIGMLVELAAGLAMVLVWVAGEFLT